MALQVRKDSFSMKELSLSSFVALCRDCPKLCREKTQRVMENRSRAPKGWEKEYVSVAEERRMEDYDMCLQYCQRVSATCPEPSAIDDSEKIAKNKSAQLSNDEASFLQRMSRCEYALNDFSQVLFSLAHKPSKVVFENIDPKTGENVEEGEKGAPSEVHKKVLNSAAINEEILNRWSTAKRGRAQMEDMGILRSAEEASQFQKDMERQKQEESAKARGTTPRWESKKYTMQQKIEGDVRVVFTLHVDQLTGCRPGTSYTVTVKRGDKIHSESSSVTADREGKVSVNMTRVFTSTMQKESNYRYKKKELKVRALELPRRKTAASLTYDLSKNMLNDCFPERKLIVKGDGGLEQMILTLEGIEEKLYNRQHSIDTVSNASLTSYMCVPSSTSQATPSVCDKTSEISTRDLSDFESVIDEAISSVGVKESNSRSPSAKSDATGLQGIEISSQNNFSDAPSPQAMPKDKPHPPVAVEELNKSFTESVQSSTDVKYQTSEGFQKAKTRPPLKVPTKRIVVSEPDSAREVIEQIRTAVRRSAATSVHQATSHSSEAVRLTLSHFFNSKEEKLEGFVLNFLAYLAVNVCQESRLLGEWLDLLTHVMYRCMKKFINIQSSRDIIRQTSVQFLHISRESISVFITQGKELLRGLRGGERSLDDVMIFWLAGLESCAAEMALQSVRPAQRVTRNFTTALTTPHEIYLTNDEKLVSNTVLLCSALDSVLSALMPSGKEDIRQASPILRIVLVHFFSSIFRAIVPTVVSGLDEFAVKSRENSSNAFRVLTILKWWARKVGLLSVLSHSLLPLVAYCDFVLLPGVLRQNDDYKHFMHNWLPHVQSSKDFLCGVSASPAAASAADAEDAWKISFIDVFTALLTPENKSAESPSAADASVDSLLETLNGNRDEATQVILEEEIFPQSGFNGLVCTLFRPDIVLPLLDTAASQV